MYKYSGIVIDLEKIEMSKKLAEMRKASGKTQREVAELLGIPTKTYQSYESGHRAMPEELFLKICESGHPVKDHKREPGRKLCSYKLKTVVHEHGDITQWFLPCIGERCMSYQDGRCVRVQ